MRLYQVNPYLEGLELMTREPMSLPEILSVSSFLGEGLPDTRITSRSMCLHAPGRRFKVDHKFPWKILKKRYLDKSSLGKNSIISILESEYNSSEEPEFKIVRSRDSNGELYVVPTHLFLRPSYTREELLNIGDPIMVGVSKETAQKHKLLRTLFDNNHDLVEQLTELIYAETYSKQLPLRINVRDTSCYGITLWAMEGPSEGFRISNRCFTEQLLFMNPFA